MPTLHAIATHRVGADMGAGEQATQGFGDGRERLVGGELAQTVRHRGRGNEAASQERQQGQDHRRVAGRLDALRGQPKCGRQPDQREGEEREQPDRGQPVERIRGRPEAERDGDAEHDGDAGQRLDEACEHVAGEHRGAGDRHRAEAVDDAAGHVHRDHDRGALNRGGDCHQQDPRRDVVQVAAATDMSAGEPA